MDEQSEFSVQKLLLVVLFSTVVIAGVYIYDKYFRNPIIVFCDVGQGDGAYIRTKSGMDIVIDFGPDKKIVDCVGKHIPIYDNEIELAFISHFDKDHYGGIQDLSSKYSIRALVYPECLDKQCHSLLNSIKGKKIPYSQSSILKSKDFLIIPLEIVNEGLATGKNNDSEVFRIEMNGLSVLFTGDANLTIVDGLLDQSDCVVDILKVPHHGSRYNLNSNFLKLADPSLSVISVGKNNQYGHPHKEVISFLRALNKKYLRTDNEGDVIVELLEKHFQVETQKAGEKYNLNYRSH